MKTTKQLAVCLIFFVAVQVIGADLDGELQSFLAATKTKSFTGETSEATKNLFSIYKKELKRTISKASDEKVRFDAFNKTLSVIIDHYRQGDKTYTLGLNEYSDWTQEELAELRGVRVPKGTIQGTNAKATDRLLTWEGKSVISKTTPPASYDLTTRVVSGTTVPVVLPVKNQGRCGSCYAFAFVALLEFQYAVQLKSSKSLSEQQMVDCSTKDSGCNGGYFTNTFAYLQTNLWQVDSEASYPPKDVSGKCAFKGAGGGGVKFGSLVYRNITTNSATAMQQSLVDYGPLWVSLFVGSQTTAVNTGISTAFGSYKSGVFQPSGCPTSLSSTNHAVAIIGYGVDTATNVPYWKVRNSWGTTWGESGYFRIRRGVNMCGIESGPFFIAQPA